MPKLSVLGTWSIGPSAFRTGLLDLEIQSTSGGSVLYGTNGARGGLVSHRISGSNGRLSYLDSESFDVGAGVEAPAHLMPVRVGADVSLISLGRHTQSIPIMEIGESGHLSLAERLDGTQSDPITTMVVHQASTRTVAYTGYWGSSDIGIYRFAGHQMQLIGRVSSPFSVHGSDYLEMRLAKVGSTDILLLASQYQDAIYSYTINANGGLAVADVLRGSDGLPIDVPSALEVVALGAERFVVLAASGTSSLTVMRLEADGQLTPTDHVFGNSSTRMQSVIAMDTISINGRAFVAVGGANDGVSLFEVLPEGRLYHWGAQADLTTTALQNVTSVAMTRRGNGIDVYASSETEAGITQLRFDLGAMGPVLKGTSGANTLSGGSRNDLLFGAAGDDTISGGSGDDVLMDGLGRDLLRGGAGADLFVLSADGERDTITDFDPSEDRLDLSAWGRLYDVSDLSWGERRTGAYITFGDERLSITTSDGSRLSADHFDASQIFNLVHTDLSYMQGGTDPAIDRTRIGDFEGSSGHDTLEGTERSDVIRGHNGHDVLRGGAGADTLNGGDGADLLFGGAGDDWVSYEGSRGSLRVDLMFPRINTNVARGDSYNSIENLIGSQGFDNLRGTLGDNVIQGGRNVDYIFGRRGNDTLEGGIGDDVLFGGVGADVLRGGANRDRAQYSEATTGITADLQDPSRNRGESVGDVYDSIEDLAGGRFSDVLRGDASANRLFGREGADHLFGRRGDDYLNGGAHADWLDGGAGNDTLRGGHSVDTFVFRSGLDVVEDFNPHLDRLAIEADLLGGGSDHWARALDFAQVLGANCVFEFDTGDQLTLLNVTDLSVLNGQIDLI